MPILLQTPQIMIYFIWNISRNVPDDEVHVFKRTARSSETSQCSVVFGILCREKGSTLMVNFDQYLNLCIHK